MSSYPFYDKFFSLTLLLTFFLKKQNLIIFGQPSLGPSGKQAVPPHGSGTPDLGNAEPQYDFLPKKLSSPSGYSLGILPDILLDIGLYLWSGPVDPEMALA
jgi:hypothetical protein